MPDGLTDEDARMRQAKEKSASAILRARYGQGIAAYRDAIRDVLAIADREQCMCENCLSGQWICDYDSLKTKIEALLEDAEDIAAAEQAMAKGKFMPLDEAKKEFEL